MKSERKKLYLYAGINFLVGTIVGIILFYGQQKNFPQDISSDYSYNKTPELIDLLKVSWLNAMWLFSVFMARSILPASPAHPILLARGVAGAFSAMYIMTCIGVKEAVFSVLPQCVSIIPIMMYFSVSLIEKRRKRSHDGKEPSMLCRTDCLQIILCAAFSAGAEMLAFMLLWRIFG